MPLQPAARVGERAVILGEAGRRKLEHLGLDRSFLARKTRSLGILSLKGKNTSPRGLAWQRFVDGESLAVACAAERVEISSVEAMLRTASSPLSKSVGMAKNHVVQSRQPRKETTPVES